MSIQADPRIGTELAGYRIDALLGRGGMGIVYRAHDLALGRDVALKLLAPVLAADVSFRERFLRESRLAASLEHPNVVPIHDAGEVDGQLYIAMRLVEGTDLKALLKAEGALAPTRALHIVEQVAGALDAAHARGLVHRDVKPSNVLVAADEHVYLADFGLSRSLGEAGSSLGATQSLGTIDYVAPEQIRGEDVDGRADVYALGCLLQECLTGEPPFRRSTDAAVLFAHLEEKPAGLPGLEQVMTKALAKEPDGRFETCHQLVEATRSALGLETKPSRWPFAVAAVGVALIGAALLAFLLTQGDGSAKAEPGADSLVRIDPKTNRVTETMPVGRKASGVAAAGRFVWVTNAGDGTIWRIDPKTAEVLKVAARGTPTGIAVGSSALVADGPEHRLVAINPASGSVRYETALPGSAGPSLQVATGEAGAWFADPAERIVGKVEEGFKGGTLSAQVRIPPDRTSLVSSYEAFDGLAVGDGSVWVAGDALGRTVWRVDPVAGSVVAKIPLSFVPGSIAAGRGSRLGHLASRRHRLAHRPKTNRITATIHVGRGVDAIAAGEGAVWVTSSIDDTVTRIDPKTNRVVARVQLDSTPARSRRARAVSGSRLPSRLQPHHRERSRSACSRTARGHMARCTTTPSRAPSCRFSSEAASWPGQGSRTASTESRSADGRSCSSSVAPTERPASALVEARRLVEKIGVDVLIGPFRRGGLGAPGIREAPSRRCLRQRYVRGAAARSCSELLQLPSRRSGVGCGARRLRLPHAGLARRSSRWPRRPILFSTGPRPPGSTPSSARSAASS